MLFRFFHLQCSVNRLAAFLFCIYLPSSAKKNHNFAHIMKHRVLLQNQSIISTKYQKLLKIPQNDKTAILRWSFIAGSVLSFSEI